MARLQTAFDGIEPLRQVPSVIVVELYTQQRGRIALDEGATHAVESRALLGVVEDEAVHDLDRGRMVEKNCRRRLERFEQIRELNRQHRFRIWERHQRDFGFDDDAERAF